MTEVRHAWLQKHPSPAAAAGEFHWFPREGDREIRATCVERMRGVEPPAVVWELAPERVVWGQPFAATAPTDGRRYVGLVLTIGEGASPATLLAELVTPPAAPWTAELVVDARPREPGLLDRFQGVPECASPATAVTRAMRALIGGGSARVGDPTDAKLARWIASLERCMPDLVVDSLRRGTWLAGSDDGQPDRVAEIAAAAWREPASSAALGWRVLGELATTRDAALDDVARDLGDAYSPLTDEERAVVGDKRPLVDVLHAWGRGQLDQCPTAGTLTERLADAVALRVLAQLVDTGDAREAIAAMRWYALLPASRRATLLGAIASRAPSLGEVIDA